MPKTLLLLAWLACLTWVAVQLTLWTCTKTRRNKSLEWIIIWEYWIPDPPLRLSKTNHYFHLQTLFILGFTMNFGFSSFFDKGKTFRPKKKWGLKKLFMNWDYYKLMLLPFCSRFQPGTLKYSLHKQAQASLNSGINLREVRYSK